MEQGDRDPLWKAQNSGHTGAKHIVNKWDPIHMVIINLEVIDAYFQSKFSSPCGHPPDLFDVSSLIDCHYFAKINYQPIIVLLGNSPLPKAVRNGVSKEHHFKMVVLSVPISHLFQRRTKNSNTEKSFNIPQGGTTINSSNSKAAAPRNILIAVPKESKDFMVNM